MTDLKLVKDGPKSPLTGVHHIGIQNDHLSAHNARLTIDGTPLVGVSAITVELAVGEITKVTLTMTATLDIELAEALVA